MLTDELRAAVETPLLPPPREACAAEEMPHRRFSLTTLLCGICIGAALLTLGLLAARQVKAIRAEGFPAYCRRVLLGVGPAGAEPLGDSVAGLAFGNTEVFPENADAALSDLYPVDPTAKETALRTKESEKARQDALAELYASAPAVPKGCYPILPVDLSAKHETELQNETVFAVDMEEIRDAAAHLPAAAIGKEPLVLIVHTHGTEGFSEAGLGYYSDTVNLPRSTDAQSSTVAVGDALREALEAQGIPTLHCAVMHDKDSYIEAYSRCADTVQEYLARYPSVRYVFDLHRDSLIRPDGTKLRPVTVKDGLPCAQLMLLIGSDEKGAQSYDWRSNLVLAEAIQCRLLADSPGVARALCLRGASYNQQLAPRSLLLEIGSCGNTLEEAKCAAKAFAKAFADVLTGE